VQGGRLLGWPGADVLGGGDYVIRSPLGRESWVFPRRGGARQKEEFWGGLWLGGETQGGPSGGAHTATVSAGIAVGLRGGGAGATHHAPAAVFLGLAKK